AYVMREIKDVDVFSRPELSCFASCSELLNHLLKNPILKKNSFRNRKELYQLYLVLNYLDFKKS
ncbi:MAG: hypothetical protein ACO259_08545, partial [Bacteroidia bacterium]